MYDIFYSRTARKQIKKIPAPLFQPILKKIESLRDEPYPKTSVKLKGYADTYRLRQGDYRIVYQVIDNELIILIVKVGHRRDIYRS